MSEGKRKSSLLGRIGRMFGGSKGAARNEEAANREEEPPEVTPEPPRFSALDLRDRVVVMLLFDQIVSIEQVEAAWLHWKRMDEDEAPSAFWRVVARLQEVDHEAAFAQAARVYAFESLDFNMYDARHLLRKHRRRFSPGQHRRMVELNVIPVTTEYNDEGKVRWVFVTHDPTRPVMPRFLSSLDVPSNILRYASESAIEDVLDDVFPDLAQRRQKEKKITLPPDLQVKNNGLDERQRIEDVARGSSFMDRVLQEVEEEGTWEEEIGRDPSAESR